MSRNENVSGIIEGLTQSKKFVSDNELEAAKSIADILGINRNDIEIFQGSESHIDNTYYFVWKSKHRRVGEFRQPKTSKKGTTWVY